MAKSAVVAGFIQTRPKRLDRESNYRGVEDLIEGVDADILVLPELFDTGYLFESKRELKGVATEAVCGETCRFLSDLAKEKNCWIAGGFPELDGGHVFNSTALAGPEGTIFIYRKTHLFFKEKDIFEPGDTGFVVNDIGIARVGMMICFDWIFPESARTLTKKGAQIILHPANLVLPYCQKAMVTRCIENRVFSITANRIGVEEVAGERLNFTGAGQIVSPKGVVLASASTASTGVFTVEINPVDSDDKYITTRNHIFNDQRPELYC